MKKESKAWSSESLTKFLKRKRSLLFFLITCGLTGIALLPQFERTDITRSLEQSALSLRFHLRGYENPEEDNARIVIVGIDDLTLTKPAEAELEEYPTLMKMQRPWPWDRSVHAHVTQRLLDAGARVVALDFLFPTPNPGDWELYDTIEANPGKIVLAFDYTTNASENEEGWIRKRLPYEDLLPLEGEEEMLGFVDIRRDQDNVLRQALLQTNTLAERAHWGSDPEANRRARSMAPKIEKQLSLGARAAYLFDPSVRDRIPPVFELPSVNYGGKSGFFQTFNYLDIIYDDRLELFKDAFKDAIVFVGPYSETLFKDVVRTPFGEMFGVEYHAHVARSLLNDSFLFEIRRSHFALLVIALAAALLIGTLKFKSGLWKSGWVALLVAGYLVLSQVAFNQLHLILPVVPVLWVLLGCGWIFIAYDFALSQYERWKLKSYLSRYVSPEVADALSDESSQLETLLKGTNRSIAVLFSDIRGFTTLSERYTPVALVAHLNDYFESMVDSIHQHDGVLNKYIGDAILAVWGGLVSAGSEKDCVHAVSSALDMERRMLGLNRKWADDPDKLPLKIGIGISYGDAFVGNLGHSNRMEFAVMGDVVNLGSRLEGATKQYGCGILVSEEVYQMCRSEIRFREIDLIRVKGKTKGVRIYEPIDFVTEPEPAWMDPWADALENYRKRDFRSAEAQFAHLGTTYPKLAKSAALYEERCATLAATPPPEDWDFVYVMQTK